MPGMKWPRSVLYILPNELCEKFSFFGSRALLNQYLKAGFGLAEGEAKAYVHLFNALVCMFPLLGGAISDSYLGKFATIVVFSLVNLAGNALLSALSIDGLVADFGNFPRWAFLVPVVLIALGAGCLKPCISAHACDQFGGREDLDSFFTAFVSVASLGILVAVTAIPAIKDAAGYPLAYAIPTAAMLLALAIFVAGKPSYRVIPPQGEFLPWKITKLIWRAAALRLKGRTADSMLDLALDDYGAELVEEARQFLRVIVIFVPIVFVWMLHEQSLTEWQNQYELMDKTLLGVHIPTEASSMYGAILGLVFVPATGLALFPALERRGIQACPGVRVALGYLLVVVSFVFSTSLQYWVQHSSTNQVLSNNVAVSCEGCVNGAWQFPQWVLISLGESILFPSTYVLAYSGVGSKMKASSISLVMITIALGNYVVIGMDPLLAAWTPDRIARQWCYVAIASFFFGVYLLLLTLWFLPSQKRDPREDMSQKRQPVGQPLSYTHLRKKPEPYHV